MNRIFVVFLSVLFLYGFSFDANAVQYKFDVKLKNNTGLDLEDVTVHYRAKGSVNDWFCWREDVSAGSSYFDDCNPRVGLAAKWQRQIRVKFTCPGQGSRTISFPRNAKFYKRDHATKNSDRYTVKLKASDC